MKANTIYYLCNADIETLSKNKIYDLFDININLNR